MINRNAKIEPGTHIWHRELSNIGACKIGTGCTIHSHVWIGDKVTIGNRVKIQAFTFIPDGVTIEDDVFIGPRVTFTNDKYPPSYGRHWKDTVVKRGATIGAGVVVLPGVTIGISACCGAGAIVTTDVEDGAIVFNESHAVRKGTRKELV